jgi:hypothetical protein
VESEHYNSFPCFLVSNFEWLELSLKLELKILILKLLSMLKLELMGNGRCKFKLALSTFRSSSVILS